MKTSLIVTDKGRAYAKCLGNPEGPHALACEWIGSRVAEILGLETLDFAQLVLTPDDVPFDLKGREAPGTAFASRAASGRPWNKTREELGEVENWEHFPRLVVLDTLLTNEDRCSPSGNRRNEDNVFLSQERAADGCVRLLAMDHSHAISNGRPLDAHLNHIDRTKDERVFGLFQAFEPFMKDGPTDAAVQSLGNLTDAKIGEILAELPTDWEVDASSRRAVRTFLQDRRDYLSETLYDRLSPTTGPQREF